MKCIFYSKEKRRKTSDIIDLKIWKELKTIPQLSAYDIFTNDHFQLCVNKLNLFVLRFPCLIHLNFDRFGFVECFLF